MAMCTQLSTPPESRTGKSPHRRDAERFLLRPLRLCGECVLFLGRSRGLRHVVAGSRARFVATIGDVHFDPAESAIHLAVAGPIADLVLGSELVMDVNETAGEILDF